MDKEREKILLQPPLNPLPIVGIAIQLVVGVIAIMAILEPGSGQGEFMTGRGCAVFLLWLSAFVGGIFGLAGFTWISAKPNKWRGISLAWFCILIAGATIFGSVYIPLKDRPYGANAKSAGRSAKLAEEVYYNDRDENQEGQYTTNLDLLLQVDKNLTDDPKVTFVFLHASNSGFTFYTQHAKSKGKAFTYTD